METENLEVILKALALYEEENLKFGDALVLVCAQVKDIKPIYTFDRDFRKFPRGEGPVSKHTSKLRIQPLQCKT